ncbi:MAG TPA: S-layer homology domain-containing protein [Epulopiscium sp.]|nr:S-layer homology domain-containing protein [Candidatus Epulonipiscium sp.]
MQRENGIVNGLSATEFAPNQAISREQLAVIIANYAEATGFEFAGEEIEKIFSVYIVLAKSFLKRNLFTRSSRFSPVPLNSTVLVLAFFSEADSIVCSNPISFPSISKYRLLR